MNKFVLCGLAAVAVIGTVSGVAVIGAVAGVSRAEEEKPVIINFNTGWKEVSYVGNTGTYTIPFGDKVCKAIKKGEYESVRIDYTIDFSTSLKAIWGTNFNFQMNAGSKTLHLRKGYVAFDKGWSGGHLFQIGNFEDEKEIKLMAKSDFFLGAIEYKCNLSMEFMKKA